jgi:hypothetical protein
LNLPNDERESNENGTDTSLDWLLVDVTNSDPIVSIQRIFMRFRVYIRYFFQTHFLKYSSRADLQSMLRKISFSVTGHKFVSSQDIGKAVSDCEFLGGKHVLVLEDAFDLDGFQTSLDAELDINGLQAVRKVLEGEQMNVTVRRYVHVCVYFATRVVYQG